MTEWPDPGPTYDRVAAAYEDRFLHELDAKPRDRELLRALAASLDGDEDGVGDGVFVDLGSGPGQIGAFVASQAKSPGVVVAALDRSREMARRAGGRLAGGAVVGDLRALPFASGRLRGITAFSCLIHLRRSELGVAVTEIARALRRGGRVLLTAHEGDGDVGIEDFLGERVSVRATFFRLDELVRSCEAAGLVVDVAERRAPTGTEGSTVRLTVLAVRP